MEDFTCLVCYEEFDYEEHSPMQTSCRHVLCRSCVEKLIRDAEEQQNMEDGRTLACSVCRHRLTPADFSPHEAILRRVVENAKKTRFEVVLAEHRTNCSNCHVNSICTENFWVCLECVRANSPQILKGLSFSGEAFLEHGLCGDCRDTHPQAHGSLFPLTLFSYFQEEDLRQLSDKLLFDGEVCQASLVAKLWLARVKECHGELADSSREWILSTIWEFPPFVDGFGPQARVEMMKFGVVYLEMLEQVVEKSSQQDGVACELVMSALRELTQRCICAPEVFPPHVIHGLWKTKMQQIVEKIIHSSQRFGRFSQVRIDVVQSGLHIGKTVNARGHTSVLRTMEKIAHQEKEHLGQYVRAHYRMHHDLENTRGYKLHLEDQLQLLATTNFSG